MKNLISILIFVPIIVYTVYILSKHMKRQVKGQCTGCSSCPHADGCASKKS
ncbi:FeoB-associated Cys-rich membrane protein [Clostridium sp. DL1XJH146]